MPYSDNQMTYNERAHRYVLTRECVLEDMNIDLGAVLNTSDAADSANAPELLLERVSALIYRYIYRAVPFRYKTERALALESENRESILEAMKEQLLYMLNNGDLSGLSGVNIDTGVVIDAKRIRDAEISPIARDILVDSGIVRSYVPKFERDIIPRYVEEGY